ncbi:MAG: sulfurtransferase complex subunit TusC [Endozoicomonas sp. (ex Botrylloides leachii)]|nr:sulfurtransferase complex subunit TusC [Endozoicomonas sp. (ex Botrylloides leachii)]
MSTAICVISTKAPYQGQSAREALDAVLVSASYGISTHLILMGDGVYQLFAKQSPEHLPRKNISSLLKSLPLYGITSIYIDAESLRERNIIQTQLLSNHTLLSPADLQRLLQGTSKILSF